MKNTKLTLAVAALLASSSAFAVVTYPLANQNLKTTPLTVPTENIMYVTGATAQTKGIGISAAKICATGSGTTPTFISLTDGAATPATVAWKCQADANATFTGMPGVTGPWIVEKNEGGSSDAWKVRTGGTVAQLTLADCTLSNATTGTCTATATQQEHLGFSDVSSKIFAAKKISPFNAAVTANQTYVTDISLGASQGFGVIVSDNLYKLMQTDQGVGAGRPSISRAQYASIITQSSGVMSTLLPNATSYTRGTVYIARRSGGSGTTNAGEVYFLNNPCSSGTSAVSGQLVSIAGNADGNGSYQFSDEGNTIKYKQEGSSTAVITEATNAVTVVSPPSATYAIGVVSLENAEPANSTTWHYLSIDGVSPVAGTALQKSNMLNGSYDFFFETYLVKNTTSTGTYALSSALRDNINDFASAMVKDYGNGANLTTSYGLFSDPNAAVDTNFAGDSGHFSRSGNECQIPVKLW